VQLHSRKTPLAPDVDFRALAEAFPRSGGDIKNAVLKAAQIATTEPGPDEEKRIHQRHFVQGMEEVIAAESVMSQSLFDAAANAPAAAMGVLEQLAEGQEQLRAEMGLLAERLEGLERSQSDFDRAQSELRGREALQAATWKKQQQMLLGLALLLSAIALVLSLLHWAR
jgi:hypothetical protein